MDKTFTTELLRADCGLRATSSGAGTGTAGVSDQNALTARRLPDRHERASVVANSIRYTTLER